MSEKVTALNCEPVTGFEVFQWPEFRALVVRLGVPMDTPIKDITITLTEETAEYTVRVLGKDMTKPRESGRSYADWDGVQ